MKGKVDGVWYDDMSQAPNLGSIRCVRNEGMIRHYNGLSADASRLPHYVETGSTCFMVDTGEMYFYEKTSDTWYKQ
jgi:hypothetical protein